MKLDQNDHKPAIAQIHGLDIPIGKEIPAGEGRFRYGLADWIERRITAREKALLEAIDSITDIPEWHKFKEETLPQWEVTARTTNPLISESSWKWIVNARDFE